MVFCAAATIAAAQGNSHGHAYGHASSGSSPAPAAAAELRLSGDGVRTFGSWLDDASILGVGDGSLTIGFGYWRTAVYHEWDLPVVDASVGLTPRVQVGFSAPYFHASEPGGAVVHGLGDLYWSAKVLLRDPSSVGRRVGFSTTPAVQMLSAAPAPGASRMSLVLPGSVEIRGPKWRVYGSGGYFSRGALFASGALEVPLSERAWVTGTISRSHSIKPDDLSRARGLAQTRTDVNGGVSTTVGSLTIFGSVGRTLSQQDANSSTLSLTGGVSVNFAAWQRR